MIIATLFLMTACGGDSGGGASTTSPGTGSLSGSNTPSSIGTNPGSTITPGTSGYTPYSKGVSESLRSALYLEFQKDSSGFVTAFGDLEMSQQIGFGSCTLPVGDYDIITSNPGREGIRVHNYNDLILDAVGPVSFQAHLENSLSIQNQNGEWVMYAVLKVQSVGGAQCNLPLSFSMPLAN